MLHNLSPDASAKNCIKRSMCYTCASAIYIHVSCFLIISTLLLMQCRYVSNAMKIGCYLIMNLPPWTNKYCSCFIIFSLLLACFLISSNLFPACLLIALVLHFTFSLASMTWPDSHCPWCSSSKCVDACSSRVRPR